MLGRHVSHHQLIMKGYVDGSRDIHSIIVTVKNNLQHNGTSVHWHVCRNIQDLSYQVPLALNTESPDLFTLDPEHEMVHLLPPLT